MSKGYEWRRAAQWTAGVLWRSGHRGQAYQLYRDVIKDGRTEAKETE